MVEGRSAQLIRINKQILVLFPSVYKDHWKPEAGKTPESKPAAPSALARA